MKYQDITMRSSIGILRCLKSYVFCSPPSEQKQNLKQLARPILVHIFGLFTFTIAVYDRTAGRRILRVKYFFLFVLSYTGTSRLHFNKFRFRGLEAIAQAFDIYRPPFPRESKVFYGNNSR